MSRQYSNVPVVLAVTAPGILTFSFIDGKVVMTTTGYKQATGYTCQPVTDVIPSDAIPLKMTMDVEIPDS